jgi:hypothetical protein
MDCGSIGAMLVDFIVFERDWTFTTFGLMRTRRILSMPSSSGNGSQ